MLKEKNYDKKDVLDESLIIANVRDMSREELEQFANRMRIDRNSFLLQKEELETELYFCYRNNKIEEIVDSRNNICFEKHECNYVHKCISSINKEIVNGS